MKWLNGYRMSVLNVVVIVIVLSFTNAWGAYFQDNFDRPDGEVGNGWETFISRRGYDYGIDLGGNVEVKIVDNEVLIAGQQSGDWAKSGISRFVEDQTRFSFDFKADDRFDVIISLADAENPEYVVSFYAWPGGPFSYMWNLSKSNWTAWTQIPGSQTIAGQYNTLVIEQGDTEFIVTLNGKVVGTVANNHITRIGKVFISGDAAFGVVGSLHIDNVVIGQPPIITNFDFNGDGIVDVKDVVTLTDHWGQDNSVCDITGDGIVDAKDLLVFASYLEQETALIAHWALDETDGMFAADSVGENDTIVFGGTTWQPSDGQIDGALLLDGIDGCVITGLAPARNPADGPFSIFVWVKGGSPGQVIVSQQAASNWLALDGEGCLMTDLKSSDQFAGPLVSETVIPDGQWHRIGLVWDGLTRTLCVDGFKVAEDTQPGLESSENSLYIGVGKDYAAGTFFSGLIDDIRIYNKALNAEQIAALAQ
jgi:hypothetical protein